MGPLWFLIQLGSPNPALVTTGTGTALLKGEAVTDRAINLTGTGTALLVGQGTQTDSPFQMAGTATALFEGVNETGLFTMNGTGSAAFAGAFSILDTRFDAGGEVGNRGSAYWRKYQDEIAPKKKRKKKDALEELDDLIIEVRGKVAPWQDAKAYEQEQAIIREAISSAIIAKNETLAKIESEIVNLKELLAEQDEEEAVMLLLM